MNRRIAKKVAKNYLINNRSISRFVIARRRYYYDDTEWIDISVKKGLGKAIRRQAYLLGWDGCHLDDPLKIYFTYDKEDIQ